MIYGFGFPYEIMLRWILSDLSHDKSTWFRQWFGAVKQQAITWANVDPELYYHKVSPGHNGSINTKPLPVCHTAWFMPYSYNWYMHTVWKSTK